MSTGRIGARLAGAPQDPLGVRPEVLGPEAAWGGDAQPDSPSEEP